MNRPERDLQVSYFIWVRETNKNSPKHQLIHATGNGNYKNIIIAKRAKEEGMLKGVWDVFVPYPAHGKGGLWIEFKSPKGRLTKEQKWFQKSLEEYYGWAIVDNLVDAIIITRDWLEAE